MVTPLPGALRAHDERREEEEEEEEEVDRPIVDDVWLARPLAELIEHIVSHYHAYTRRELATLRAITAELQESDGVSRPELRAITTLLLDLENEMIPHMVKEERIIFPYVVELEARARVGSQRPHVESSSAENPLRKMMQEHDHAQGTLRALRRACTDYVTPRGASAAVAELYARLARLERTLRHHVHLESDIVFRRAVELEHS